MRRPRLDLYLPDERDSLAIAERHEIGRVGADDDVPGLSATQSGRRSRPLFRSETCGSICGVSQSTQMRIPSCIQGH